MKTLLVFGEDWGRHPSSTQHLMPYLAEKYRIVWINSIGLRRPRGSLQDIKRLVQKAVAMLRPTQKARRSGATKAPFPVIAPRVYPLPKTRLGRWLNRVLLRRQLKPFLDTAEDIWVWASLPSAVDFYGAFGETRWFYYCGDDFGSLAGVDHDDVRLREMELVMKADWVWAASETLVQRFSGHPVSLLAHGVHLQHFQTPAPRPAEINPHRRTLGFYGAVAEWVDQSLLVSLAQRLPDWDIMLIGPTLVEVSALAAQTNIRLLPAMPHEALPGYLQHWDAAILPFVDNDQIRACNPLKLREYLASGTPVLATPFPALAPYHEHVYRVSDVDDTAQWLRFLHTHDNDCLRQDRQRSVEQESWAVRADSAMNTMAVTRPRLEIAQRGSQFKTS